MSLKCWPPWGRGATHGNLDHLRQRLACRNSVLIHTRNPSCLTPPDELTVEYRVRQAGRQAKLLAPKLWPLVSSGRAR
jgi:hypothetical protein